MSDLSKSNYMKNRFRGFLPVIVDVETAGFDAEKDALLEAAFAILEFDEHKHLFPAHIYHQHIIPFDGANLDKDSLEFNGINPHHPFRFAVSEKDALKFLLAPVEAAIKKQGCQRAVLVGHNPAFDLSFLNAALRRCNLESPFHQFTTFDTATLAGVAYGQTVLLKAAKAAGISFDQNQAHSAIYDTEKTAELFCKIVNDWPFKARS
jgi:ribonuclease T